MTEFTKSAYTYVARKPCGCVIGLVGDRANGETAKAVAEWIKDGLSVDRVSDEKLRGEIFGESGFLDCIHVEPEIVPPMLPGMEAAR